MGIMERLAQLDPENYGYFARARYFQALFKMGHDHEMNVQAKLARLLQKLEDEQTREIIEE